MNWTAAKVSNQQKMHIIYNTSKNTNQGAHRVPMKLPDLPITWLEEGNLHLTWQKDVLNVSIRILNDENQTILHNEEIGIKGEETVMEVSNLESGKYTDDYGILLGNPKGSVRIIEACNPFCGHCGIAHGVLCELLEDNPNLCLQIMFVMGPEDAGHDKTPIDMFLTLSKNGEDMSAALKDWYAQTIKDADVFGREHSVRTCRSKENDQEARKMSDFCKSMEITNTPTFFINAHELPSLYHVGDLKYFV